MKLGDYYRVEGLVRLAEGRMFYLLNDDRPDLDTRICWECGFTDTPRSQKSCQRCGETFTDRRFLMSVRWDGSYDPYLAFHELQLEHPGLIAPVEVFLHENLLCSVFPYRSESLLLDECAPLTPQEMLDFSQRIAGILAFLGNKGVTLSSLAISNVLLTSDNKFVLFDLSVESVQDHPISPDLADLTLLLRRFSSVECGALWSLIDKLEKGQIRELPRYGESLQGIFPALEAGGPPYTAVALTDVGLCRDLNEDNWNWAQLSKDVFLFVVADGMGGHASGEVASEIASRTICDVARQRIAVTPSLSVDVLENILDEAFQTANNTVKEFAERNGNDMGTTLVAVMMIGNETALMANVGDSRGYLLRDRVLHQVTRDHSLVARMVEQNRITAEEARTHPHSNILLRTVGTERDVEIDIFSVELEPGDKMLLCSDGLWGEVEDRDIEQIMTQYTDTRVGSRELIRAAHHGGGKDNITLMIVENSVARPPG